MPWLPFSFHFRQLFADGYRYLDRCGEFMLAAQKHGFMPGEIKVSSGQLGIPEEALHAVVSANELTVRQDLPPVDGVFFLEKCIMLAALTAEKFGPLDLQSNGFAGKWYWPAVSSEDALERCLRFKQSVQDELGKAVEMVPSAARLDFNFVSGNSDLHFVLQPVAFENVTVERHGLPFRPTREQQSRVRRLKNSKHDFPQEITNALLLEADLTELDPPLNSLEGHFGSLTKKSSLLLNRFS